MATKAKSTTKRARLIARTLMPDGTYEWAQLRQLQHIRPAWHDRGDDQVEAETMVRHLASDAIEQMDEAAKGDVEREPWGVRVQDLEISAVIFE